MSVKIRDLKTTYNKGLLCGDTNKIPTGWMEKQYLNVMLMVIYDLGHCPMIQKVVYPKWLKVKKVDQENGAWWLTVALMIILSNRHKSVNNTIIFRKVQYFKIDVFAYDF